MKKIIILNLLLISSIFANSYSLLKETSPDKSYKDFGVFGKTYPILETPFMDILKKRMEEYKLSQKNIKDQVMNQIKMAAFESTELPLCKDYSKEKPKEDFITIQMDIINPFGRVIYKKGDKIKSEIKNGKILDLCFIDYRNKIVGKNQINELKKIYPDCMYIVANKNVLSIRKDFPNLDIYPTSKGQEDRFGIKCYPSVVHMEKDTIQKTYYPYEQFKN